jgi:hypothetical protein
VNEYFPSFEKSTLHMMSYDYEPLNVLIHAILQFTNENYEDGHSKELLKTAKTLLNLYLSGKPIPDDIPINLKKLCCGKRTKTTKIINNIIKHIDSTYIISECLEHLVLNNSFDKLGLLFESKAQWDFIYLHVQKRELDSFIIPVSKNDLREKYFNFPIITFLPASWIPELIILPPSENFFLIAPSIKNNRLIDHIFFKAPNNASIEVSSDQIETIHHETMHLADTDEFKKEFVESEETALTPIIDVNIDFFDVDELNSTEKYTYAIRLLDLVDVKGKGLQLEANKSYVCISKSGIVNTFSFENEYQFNNMDYIVNDIDTTSVSEADIKGARNSIMEQWKKSLRKSLSDPTLPKQLKALGAKRANYQNIKNWGDPERIAPAYNEDFLAVLKFSGITNEQDIKSFFTLARKTRSESISLGHRKSDQTQEIIKNFLTSKINESSSLEKEYNIHGIKINITRLESEQCQL